ncbi:MAG: hypothetical protein AB9903_00760 [Vulcanimicrobiota bacterium]
MKKYLLTHLLQSYRDALASAQFRKPFAARYYNDFLKTTLDTYFRRKVEAEKEANQKAAEADLQDVRIPCQNERFTNSGTESKAAEKIPV